MLECDSNKQREVQIESVVDSEQYIIFRIYVMIFYIKQSET